MPLRKFLKVLVHDYSWIHLSLGLVGNLTFLVGSVLFLPRFTAYQTLGVWLFIAGAALMSVGSIGRLLVDILEEEQT